MVAGRRDNYFNKKRRMPDGGYTGSHGRRICSSESCAKAATYGRPGAPKATSCGFHKTPDMIDMVNRKCVHPGCSKQPSFGFPEDGKKPSRCAEHKLDGMTNVLARTCAHRGCRTRPSYGFVGGKASRCVLHREDGMVSTLAGKKTCAVGWCTVSPSFGFEGPEGPTRCKAHPLPGLDRVLRKTSTIVDDDDDDDDDDDPPPPGAPELAPAHAGAAEAWLADLRMSDALGEIPGDARHALLDWIDGPGPTEAEARGAVGAANAIAREFGAREASLDCRRGAPTWHDLALAWVAVASRLPAGARRGWIDPATGDGVFASSLKKRTI